MSNQETKNQHQPAPDAPRAVEKNPKRRRGFFSTIFSHLMVAAIAVIAVGAYMHWVDILTYTSSKVCAYDALGQYSKSASKPASKLIGQTPSAPEPTVPPIDLKKPAAKADEQQQQPAEKKLQAKSTSKTEAEKELQPGWQAARKMFWANDESTAAAYEKLVADFPEKAELRAELGNVYFKNGKKDEAVDMYLSAGKLFSSQKNISKAAEMKQILEKLAPEKAAEIPHSDKKPVQ